MLTGIVAALTLHQAELVGVLELTAELKKLEQNYVTSRESWEKSATEETSDQFVSAAVEFGTAVMTSPDLPSNLKYKKALILYRRALQANPKQEEALSNSAMIESIYESLGKPIPK